MRVLFVTNRFPGQLRHGDQLRAYQHLRQLAPRHAVTLLCFDSRPADPQRLAELRAICADVLVVRRPRWRLLLRAVHGLAGTLPLQVAMHASSETAGGLPALLGDLRRFDLAHLQLARLGPLLQQLAPLPCVLDLVDALSLNMRRRAALDRGLAGWLARLEAPRLERYERRLCAAAAAACVCAETDRQAIGVPGLALVGNGVDLDAFAYAAPSTRASSLDLVFVGNLGYFPNVDGASWFAAEVLPRIRAVLPAVRLLLVGVRPAAALRRLAARQPGVVLVGPVARVQPWLAAAALAVVPLRAGSGQQLKLLEAMAAGTPVLASPLAAAGLAAVDGRELRIAAGAAEMAAVALELLSDPGQRERLAAAARAWVELRHGWQHSADELERLWLRAAGLTAAPAPP